MNRIEHSFQEESDWGLQAGRQLAQVKSAFLGRAGQKVLAELKQALLAMPERRLIQGWLCDDVGDVCALGCLARSRGISDAELIQGSQNDDADSTDWAIVHLRLSATLAWVLQEANDEICGSYNTPPEQLYQRVLAWVQSWLTNGEMAYRQYRSEHLP